MFKINLETILNLVLSEYYEMKKVKFCMVLKLALKLSQKANKFQFNYTAIRQGSKNLPISAAIEATPP